jgi:hypothetical protein
MTFTKEEFVEYINNLEFYELEDAVEFVMNYWEDYAKDPENYDKRYKYNACISRYGHMFLFYTSDVIKLRKNYEARKAVGQSE